MARKRGRTQKSLGEEGVDVKLLLLWMVKMIPRPVVAKKELLSRSRKYSKAAKVLGIVSRSTWQPMPSIARDEDLQDVRMREPLIVQAELRKALASPQVRLSDTALRCMSVDAVTLATGRQHYDEVTALLTQAYRLAGAPCIVLARSLQKLVHDHRLEPGSKLTIFSLDPYRQHIPQIKL